jgi:hypothetical protein
MDFASIYGPLDKQACVYFSALTIFFFILLVIALVSELFYLVRNYKNVTGRNVVSGILLLFNVFLAYFVNRLLYNMCSRSLA